MARFLVIDDDNTLRFMMATTLESAGHTVTQAASGSEGAALFNAQPTDVVITDVVLPDDSIHAVVELRRQHPTVPFIIVSGLAQHSPRSMEISSLLNARRTLPKPFRLPDFLGITDEVLAEQNISLPAVKKRR